MLDYLKLHCVILMWGMTAVLGKLIDLTATELVITRSGLAALVLGTLLRSRMMIQPKIAMLMIGNGMILGAHWITFFVAVKISSVSVCMIGMATVSFWTALLEPMMIRRVRFVPANLILGLIGGMGVALIYGSETQFQSGIVVALGSAVLACVFSIFNGQLFDLAPTRVIVSYQMVGSSILCASVLGLSEINQWGLGSEHWLLTPMQWVWIAILVLVCTIFAYGLYISLLQRLSVFTINFANNLEPIYGIILGALLFRDHEYLSPSFYTGAFIIVVAVMLQPWLTRSSTPQHAVA
ncbi:EamA-like transporter family protein [Rubripirellula amarantea]|uniref:EamA-like transporter family protein n=1 Tax=Rubripirellula amarantea TaxID=2527999 RepID=A0A5C5WKX9_9BACT|nr:DMT family transporter [Rubripirellula amarantea]TWT50759.1 EamA-like transporter family protein [Rubripirellula amarantea]